MSDKLKKEFENFESSPSEELWENIKSQLIKPKFNWLAFLTITGAGVLVLGAIILILSPIVKENKVTNLIEKEINKNTTTITPGEKPIVEKQDIVLTKNSVKEEKNNPITNYVEPKANNTVKYDNNIVNQNNNVQLKEEEKSTNKLIKNPSFYSNSSKTTNLKTNSFIRQQELSNKSPEINTNDTNTARLQLFIPNAFTPNEPTNNTFKPAFTNLKSYEMNIFNRNGVLLFTSKDINRGWNGYYNGRLCDFGAYVYVIKFENLEGVSNLQRGSVTLIR